MKNGIILCGPISEQKNEIVTSVKEYFSKSSEVVLSQDAVVQDTQNFVVYIGDGSDKKMFDGVVIAKKFYDISTGRRLTSIAGQIIVDYMAWCREKNTEPAEPAIY